MVATVEAYNWQVPFKWKIFSSLVSEVKNAEEYRDTLLNSSFTLCPVGGADDNFRFWEAIEAGSVPIFVRRDPTLKPTEIVLLHRGERHCPGSFQDIIDTNPPIVLLDDWTDLPVFFDSVTERQIHELQTRLYYWNIEFWRNTSHKLDNAIHKKMLKWREKKKKNQQT